MSVIRCDEHDLIIDTDFESGCWKCNEEEDLSPCHAAPIVEQTEDTTGFCEECGEQPRREADPLFDLLAAASMLPPVVLEVVIGGLPHSTTRVYTLSDLQNGVPIPESLQKHIDREIIEDGEWHCQAVEGRSNEDFAASILEGDDWREKVSA